MEEGTHEEVEIMSVRKINDTRHAYKVQRMYDINNRGETNTVKITFPGKAFSFRIRSCILKSLYL